MSLESNKDKAFGEWLNSLEDRYQDNCRLAFGKFMEFLKEKSGWKEVSGDLILSRHEANRKSDDKKVKYYFDDLIPTFVTWYEAKGVSHNYATVQVAMVRSFFKFHREPLLVQKKIKLIEVKKRYHSFTKDELVKMVQVGDLDEKVLIMLGVQLGIRVGDFVSLQREPILEAYLNSNGVFPLQFEIETEKEGVISVGHISKDVYETLKLYWGQVPKSEYAFPSNNGRVFISEDKANDMIKNTWRKAYPERKDVKVRFHELQSYKISVLANSGVNEWIIKKMTGKKVSSDMNGYLTGINLKDGFKKAEEALTLT
jgi:integrase